MSECLISANVAGFTFFSQIILFKNMWWLSVRLRVNVVSECFNSANVADFTFFLTNYIIQEYVVVISQT